MARSIGLALLGLAGMGLVGWIVASEREPSPPTPPRVESEAAPAVRAGEPATPPTLSTADREAIAEVAPTPEPTPASPARPSSDFGALLVTVLSRESKLPLEGIRLQPILEALPEDRVTTLEGSSRGSEYACPLTGPDGRAVLSLPSGRSMLLDAWSDRLGALRSRTEVPALEPLEEREIELSIPSQPDLLCVGRLECMGRALPRREILLRQEGWTLERTLTDREGRFSFRTCSWREPYLRIDVPGCTPALVRVCGPDSHGALPTPILEPGGLAASLRDEAQVAGLALVELPIVLERSASLSLVVREGALPAPDLPVCARVAPEDLIRARGEEAWPCPESFSWSATTDEKGRCALALPAGVPILLRVGGREERLTGLDPGSSNARDIVLSPRVELRGRIVDQHGEPLADQEIQLSLAWKSLEPMEDDLAWSPVPMPQNGPRLDRWLPSRPLVRSDADGRFVFERVVEGEVLLRLLPLPRADGRRIVAKTFPVTVGRETPGEVELVVDCDLFLSGVVVEEHDWKLNGVHLTATPVGAARAVAWTQSDAEGRFELGPVERGSYELRAATAAHVEHESPVLTVAAGTDGLLVRLELLRPEGRITGFALDESGSALEATVVLVEGSGEWTSFEHLPFVLAEFAFAGDREGPIRSLPRSIPGPDGPRAVIVGAKSDPVSGAFELDDVLPGDYTLVAVTERSHGFQQVHLASRRGRVDGVAVRLLDGAELVVELPQRLGERFATSGEWRVVVSEARGEEPLLERTFHGSSSAIRLPPGDYHVELTDVATGRSDWEGCELANGSRARLLLFRHF